ncbi:MAG: ketol-acid reductoisomerase [Actinomycetes bacterium]|jgi:ketol-acid reductoisomerase|nr:ketol-acid reductoisomerase [Actinomycetes bacterium]
MKRYDDSDFDPTLIQSRVVAMVGYGSQGRSAALNLRDSGVRVVVAVRNPESVSARQARTDGFELLSLSEAAGAADFLMVMTPDEVQGEVFRELTSRMSLSGKTLAFAHGYAIRFGLVVPPDDVDVVMIAPKGVGVAVRARYEAGSGVPGLVAVHHDATGQAEQLALSYAWANGHARTAVFATTFAEECEADLFSEQAVIAGGLTQLLDAGFDTLVEAGFAPEVAWFECIYEAKLILDLIVERGFARMFEGISNTAEFGAHTAGARVISPEVRAEMGQILAHIKDGAFAGDWAREVADGSPTLTAERARWRNSLLVATQQKLADLL